MTEREKLSWLQISGREARGILRGMTSLLGQKVEPTVLCAWSGARLADLEREELGRITDRVQAQLSEAIGRKRLSGAELSVRYYQATAEMEEEVVFFTRESRRSLWNLRSASLGVISFGMLSRNSGDYSLKSLPS